MLRFVFTDIDNNSVNFSGALSVSINKEEGVPADDMVAVFPYSSVKELKSITVYDGDDIVFTGVVDEQIVSVKANLATLKICARSMAALLLDNESVPVSYNYPSKNVVVRNHAELFGIKASDKSPATYFGTQTVAKGSTNWQALNTFSKNVYGRGVRINECGKLLFSPENQGDCVFSDSNDGIVFESIDIKTKRCEEISRVRIKVTNSSGYHSVVENRDAINRGIVRERYLNAVLTDTPAVCAENMIRKSKENACVVTLSCVGRYLNILGMNAKINSKALGEIYGLYVSSVLYRLSDKGELTTVILKRKEV